MKALARGRGHRIMLSTVGRGGCQNSRKGGGSLLGDRMRWIVLVLVVALVAGCGMRELQNLETPYVASDYLPYAQPGTASIAGTVADRPLGGRAMTCAGMNVELMPATAFTREMVAIIRAGKLPSGRASPENKTLLKSVIKKTTCDGSGHFTFDKLAAGT